MGEMLSLVEVVDWPRYCVLKLPEILSIFRWISPRSGAFETPVRLDESEMRMSMRTGVFVTLAHLDESEVRCVRDPCCRLMQLFSASGLMLEADEAGSSMELP
ncbi:hypothetical protein Nepgr_021068 [Nepenthes gracilis]|uniref:Uncharacterized protein n=1 Tax=Nepenthes gracilis TaxID=150966 RepID=A0AAD3XVM4_NEPGR|nr:hypothetical protein Nepgr_021068 [Nepenthes gracilis]